MEENIYILIESENDINTEKFKQEILTNGSVKLFKNNHYTKIECVNKKLLAPPKYNCLLVDGNPIYILIIIKKII